MSDIVGQYSRRPSHYEFIDGTGDLVLGVWLLVCSFGLWLSRESLVTWRFCAGAFVLWGATLAITHFGTRAIRARWIYRRSGYIQRRLRPWPLVLFLLLVAVISAGVSVGAVIATKSGFTMLSVPLLSGLGIGLSLSIGVLRARRFAAYAALSVSLGVALQFLNPTMVPGLCWYYLLMGVALLITGAITLHRFVRDTPAQASEAQ
jgi:hypothetical protein